MGRKKNKLEIDLVGDTGYLTFRNGVVATFSADDIDVVEGRGWYLWSSTKHDLRYVVNADGEKLHRLIMEKHHGPLGDLVIDHLDGSGLNNCRTNLRAVTQRENRTNARKQSRQIDSGLRGVYAYPPRKGSDKQLWRVSANFGGKNYVGGIYSDLVEAGQSADMMNLTYRPNLIIPETYLNFPHKLPLYQAAISGSL